MNFPVVFRIYAVINLLAFLAFGFFTVVLTAAAPQFGPVPIGIHWAITVWLFVSALSWFFASKFSYHFLFSLSFLLLAVAATWIAIVFFGNSITIQGDGPIFLAVAGCCIFYTIFLIVAAFYKPVVEWTSSRWNTMHHGIMAGLLLLVTGGFVIFGKLYRQTTEIGMPYSLYSNGAYEDVPLKIYGSEWLKVEFNGVTAVNTLVIPDDTTMEAYPLTVAKMFYSDTAGFDYKVAPSKIITFEKMSGRWVAEFPEVKARVLQIFPMETKDAHANPKTSFMVAGITPLWTYGYFDPKTPPMTMDDPTYGSYADYESYDEGEATADAGSWEGNGRELTSSNIIEFYTLMAQHSSVFNSSWMFSEKTDRIGWNDGETTRQFGMYTQGIGTLWYCFGYTVKDFRQYSDYDFERFVTELSGNSLYSSHARTYDNEGNGTHFNYINPTIITWAEENLIVDPNTKILGHSAQEYYDVILKRFMRMMVHSHNYLKTTDIDAELDAYVAASSDEHFYGPQYIMNRYASLPFDQYNTDSEWKDGSDFIGFWLRRKKDGTYDECLRALSKIMDQYDSNWYEQSESEMDQLMNNQGDI